MRRLASSTQYFTSLGQLAMTLLVTAYMLLVGGSFDAGLRFQVKLLTGAGAFLLAGAWLVWRMWRRQGMAATGVQAALLLLWLTQGVAVLGSLQPRLSLETWLSLLGWSLAFVVLSDLLAAGWPRGYVLNSLVLVAAAISLAALGEVLAWTVPWLRAGQWPPFAFRLTGLLGHPNPTAAALNLLLPLVLLRAAATPRRAARLALIGLAALMLLAVFFTSSRAGWIGTAATLGMLGLVWGARQQAWVRAGLDRWRAWPAAWRLGSVALLLSLGAAAAALLIRQSQHATHGSLLGSRTFFWQTAWGHLGSRPLTGVGPGLYAWLYSQVISIPPMEVVPHAHSLLMQVLGGSGLIGLAGLLGMGGWGLLALWRRWREEPDAWVVMAAGIGLAGAVVHQFFDYFFDNGLFVFLFVALAALALAPSPARPRRGWPAAWLALPLGTLLAFSLFTWRAAGAYSQGAALAGQGRWAEAARALERAARLDPDFVLYWEEAAQARTRSGDLEAAIPMWRRAAAMQPHWAIPYASLALLTGDQAEMQVALRLAPLSHLLQLNAGALAEQAGDADSARGFFRQALVTQPGAAGALFWEQTPLRRQVRDEWQAQQTPDTSALARGWAALEHGEAGQALELFEQARAEAPLSNVPYQGLARAAWALGDREAARGYLQTGKRLQVYTIRETLGFLMIEGDWAAEAGDTASALQAYAQLFSAYNDYSSQGPGTFGYPDRTWKAFHREGLPTDLVPQFQHADITPELEARFLQLARGYLEAGQSQPACLVLERVLREVPLSDGAAALVLACR